jgi:addiction module HigA family antidote
MDAEVAEDLLAALHAATSLDDLRPLKSVGLHKLSGSRKGRWAMTVNGPWRICFRFADGAHGTSRSSTIIEEKLTMKPVHPGRLLRREMQTRKLSANALALALRVSSGRITDILNEKRGVSPETAMRLARYFGNSARFWLNLQTTYELGVAEAELSERIAAEVAPAAA